MKTLLRQSDSKTISLFPEVVANILIQQLSWFGIKKIGIVFFTLISSLGFISPSFGGDNQKEKKAIVLAQFGTSYPSALVSIINIQNEVQKAFPGVKVKLAFTSNIIRKIWQERRGDKQFFSEHKGISEDIVYVKGPLATIADLQDEGYQTIIVQPTHIYAGEEYMDVSFYLDGLNSIKTIKPKYMPFKKLVLGRPLLGKPGPLYDYHHDMEAAARALAADINLARKNKAALVYMGHGNEYYSTGAYIEFQQVLRKMYPDTKIFIGTVEGFPALDDVVKGLNHTNVKKVVLKPFMIVAGDHANNDMVGDEDDSWKMILQSKGIKIIPVLRGMGENKLISKCYVQHIKDVARGNHIDL
jgi:sirohydrochlorin cobaltochelatase